MSTKIALALESPLDADVLASRSRAKARNRALARLAQEYPDRYRELYAEERRRAER